MRTHARYMWNLSFHIVDSSLSWSSSALNQPIPSHTINTLRAIHFAFSLHHSTVPTQVKPTHFLSDVYRKSMLFFSFSIPIYLSCFFFSRFYSLLFTLAQVPLSPMSHVHINIQSVSSFRRTFVCSPLLHPLSLPQVANFAYLFLIYCPPKPPSPSFRDFSFFPVVFIALIPLVQRSHFV